MSKLIVPAGFKERQRDKAKELTQSIGHALSKAFPNHIFTLQVDERHGWVRVDHILLASNDATYVAHNAEDIPTIIRNFAEMLERVNIPRGKLESIEQYIEAMVLAKAEFRAA